MATPEAALLQQIDKLSAPELRRMLAEHDATLLRELGPADDLDAVVDWSVRHLADDGGA